MAKEQLKSLIDTGLKLPNTVSDNEKHLIIAVRVFSKPNPVTRKFESTGNIVKFDVKAWEAAKAQFGNLGYEIHVLHDPREVEVEDETNYFKLLKEAKELGMEYKTNPSKDVLIADIEKFKEAAKVDEVPNVATTTE